MEKACYITIVRTLLPLMPTCTLTHASTDVASPSHLVTRVTPLNQPDTDDPVAQALYKMIEPDDKVHILLCNSKSHLRVCVCSICIAWARSISSTCKFIISLVILVKHNTEHNRRVYHSIIQSLSIIIRKCLIGYQS